MKYLLQIEPKRRKAFCFQELGSPAIVEVPCAMYSDCYLKRDMITWGMFRGKPHKFLSHIMPSLNVKCSLQKSLELTLKCSGAHPKEEFACDLSLWPKIWAREDEEASEEGCVSLWSYFEERPWWHSWCTPIISETHHPHDTVESSGGTSKKY